MKLYYSHIILLTLLIFSVYFDSTQRKIPNKITLPAILVGVTWSTMNSGLDGFLFSVLGFLLGSAVFLIPYILGGIGAGDVKLMAAIGSLMGWRFTIASGLSTAIAGGVLVIIYMSIKGELKTTLVDALGLLIKPLLKFFYIATSKKWFLEKQKIFIVHKVDKPNDYVPYAIAISTGTLVVLFFGLESLIPF